MKQPDFSPGDIVRHKQMSDAVGVLIERSSFPLTQIQGGPIFFWDILWLSHREGSHHSTITEKWIKPYRGYKKRTKQVDK